MGDIDELADAATTDRFEPRYRPQKQYRPTRRRKSSGLGLRAVGTLLFFLGWAGLIFFLLFFDVSVPTSRGRVVNLSLMNERQVFIIASCGLLITGAIIFALGYMNKMRNDQ